MTHMRGMLFIERSDNYKLFFKGSTGLMTGKPYESFDIRQPEELYEKIMFYEKINPRTGK